MKKLAYLLLLLMAATLIPTLNDQGLWGDEGWSVRFAEGSPRQVTWAVVEDRHPPLYFLMLRGWREIAGDDEVALRILTVFHTLLTAAFLYQLGRELFSESAALGAMLIYTLSDQQVVWTQEVRHYPLLLMWIVAATWALVRWLRYGKSADHHFYLFCVIAGLYTHNFMLLVLLSHGLYALIKYPRRLGRLILLYSLAGIAFAPWALVFRYQFLVHGGLKHDLPLNWTTAEFLGKNFLGSPMALMGILLILGILSPWLPRFKQPSANFLPVLSGVLPIALIIGLTLLDDNYKLLTDRNLSIILPFLALLIGVGLTAFDRFGRGVIVGVLLLNGLLTTDSYEHKPPWRPIARYVAQHQVDDQPIVLDVGGDESALRYHLQQEAGDVPQVLVYTLQNTPEIELYTWLRFVSLAEAEGFWYVVWGDSFEDAFQSWEYTRTATALDYHLGSPIYMYRYDQVALKNEVAATFGDQLRLHRVWLAEEENMVKVALWWSAAQALAQDYTASVFLMNSAGAVVAQQDHFPQDSQTSTWQPDQLFFEMYDFDVPPGEYTVGVRVYSLAEGGQVLPVADGDYFEAGRVE